MKSILITIAISVYMTFTVVTIQVANKQTLATSDVTLDIVEVMTRAFDESEGGESTTCPALSQDYIEENPNVLQFYCGVSNGFTCEINWFVQGQEQPIDIYIITGAGNQHGVITSVICLPDVVINP